MKQRKNSSLSYKGFTMQEKPQKAWYQKKHGKLIAVITFPIFSIWYIWTKLEKSKLFKIGATGTIVVIFASLSMIAVFAYQQPSTTQQAAKDTPQANNSSSTVSNKTATDTQQTETATSTDSNTTNTTNDTPISSAQVQQENVTTITPIDTAKQETIQPELTLEQQYPDTYPEKWSNAPIDSLFDDWNMSNRESVSYTAWKVNEAYGNMPKSNFGNANDWPAHAQTVNIPTGTVPKVHSVGILFANSKGAGPSGFSAWIEAIDGDKVIAGSYNFNTIGTYNVEKVSASYFDTYIYFGDK